MDISSYVSHHREALTIVEKLQKLIKESQPAIPEISKTLIELTGKLKFHLSMEDKFINPHALTSSHPDLQTAAKKMQAEMIGIADAFNKYAAAWNANTISKEFGKFVTETNGIIAALGKRIDAEEKTFYPLVQKYL